MEVVPADSLITEMKLLDNPQAGGVLGPDVDLHTMQAEFPKAEVGGHRDGSGSYSAPGSISIHPVSERCCQSRSPDDSGNRQLTHNRRSAAGGTFSNNERQRGCAPGLGIQCSDHLVIGGQVSPGRRVGRLPRGKPFQVPLPQLHPLTLVAVPYGPKPEVPGFQRDWPVEPTPHYDV